MTGRKVVLPRQVKDLSHRRTFLANGPAQLDTRVFGAGFIPWATAVAVHGPSPEHRVRQQEVDSSRHYWRGFGARVRDPPGYDE